MAADAAGGRRAPRPRAVDLVGTKRTVGAAMSRALVTVTTDESLAEAGRRLRAASADSVVVLEDDWPVGILGGPDLTGCDPTATCGRAVHRTLLTVDPRAPVGKAAVSMRGAALGRLAVVDSGRLVGVLSLVDIEDEAPGRG